MNSQQFYAIMDKLQVLEQVVYGLGETEWLEKAALINQVDNFKHMMREIDVKNEISR